MEENKKSTTESEKEIVYSQTVRAGKRIYYIDVKKNRKDDMFLAITESKKIISGNNEETQVNFEKHKIFLYQEDFEHFMQALQEAMHFIGNKQDSDERKSNISDSDLNFDIKF